MSKRQPRAARPYLRDDSRPAISWPEALNRFQAAKTFWLTTRRPDGRPHVMPLLAVGVGESIYFCAGPGTVKARNLLRESRCTLSTSADGVDMVMEGQASRVLDPSTVRRAAAAYMDKYGWDAGPRGDALYGEGAPTAGPSPLFLYEFKPNLAFAFGVDESANAMRWVFA